MKVLLIGLGNSGQAHLRAYRALHIRPHITDQNPRKEEQALRKGYRIGDPDQQYDYVDICVPTHRHFQLCKEWLPISNVLCEKPFTLESKNAQTLIQLADQHSRKLGIVHNQLYYPMLRKFNREPIKTVLIERSYDEAFPPWIYTDGGGPLYEVGYHALYTLLYLTGTPKLRCYSSDSEGQTLIFDRGKIRVFTGSKFEDSIQLNYRDGKETLYPWFNSQMKNKLMRRLTMYYYCATATNRTEMPHTSTYREMLDEWVTYVKKKDSVQVPARLSPDLSLETVKVLESCEKWSDREE